MMFHVGQMVAFVGREVPKCPRGFRYVERGTNAPLTRGMIYTIRGFWTAPGLDLLGVYLDEVTNPTVQTAWGPAEASYHSTHFRPVKETNIEIFRKLVAPSPDKVTA